MRICKIQKPCINSTCIDRIIHWVLSFKTWLLIVCDMAFYAIILVHKLCPFVQTSKIEKETQQTKSIFLIVVAELKMCNKQ